MKNCVILGSGRSGTSLVAGLLQHSGYAMGDDLYPAMPSNPKGFFESPAINQLNTELIELSKQRNRELWATVDPAFSPRTGASWLECVPVGVTIPSTAELDRRIGELTAREPFCYKDPRFSYTLPAWRPFLRDPVFLCVFREPAVTAASIMKECRTRDYLRHVTMTPAWALELWFLMYSHILTVHRQEGTWLFIHYRQAFTGTGLDRLASLTGAEIDRSFPDRALQRSTADLPVPAKHRELYATLCRLAHYQEEP